MENNENLDIFDTNCLGDLPNLNQKCLISDVSLCELLKEKSKAEKRVQFKLIIDFIKRTGSTFAFMPMNQKRYNKYERAKSEKAAFNIMNKIAESTFIRIAMMYIETVLAILLIIIHKKNGTEVIGDNLIIKKQVDMDTHYMCMALKTFYEKYLYPNKNKLFRKMYRKKDKNTMNEVGITIINAMVKAYNKHISDESLKNMVPINGINQTELLKEIYGKISEKFIKKILESYFDYCKNDEPTYFVMFPYIKNVLFVSGKLEFNDISDYINVFAAKTLGCKLYTHEKKIVKIFPTIAVLAQ